MPVESLRRLLRGWREVEGGERLVMSSSGARGSDLGTGWWQCCDENAALTLRTGALRNRALASRSVPQLNITVHRPLPRTSRGQRCVLVGLDALRIRIRVWSRVILSRYTEQIPLSAFPPSQENAGRTTYQERETWRDKCPPSSPCPQATVPSPSADSPPRPNPPCP